MKRSGLGFIVFATFAPAVLAGPSSISWTLFPPGAVTSGGLSAGALAFQNACAVCHGATESPGTVSLTAKYQGVKPGLLEQRRDLTAPVVLFYIRQGVAMMAPLRKTELSDVDARAIAEYLSRKKKN